MDLAFSTLDVFTATALEGGNPLAVVEVPAARRARLTRATKQRIAREFNLSETAFLHEPAVSEDPAGDDSRSGGGGGGGGSSSSSSSRNVEIFTVDREVPFAGHPTIGTAMLLRNYLTESEHPGGARVDTLVTKAGPISLYAGNFGGRPGVYAKIPHDVRVHSRTLGSVVGGGTHTGSSSTGSRSSSGHNSSLSQQQQQQQQQRRAAELAAPIVSIVNGMTFLLVHLPSLAALASAATATTPLTLLRGLGGDGDAPPLLLDEGWRDSLVCAYYYVDVSDGPPTIPRKLRTRLLLEEGEGGGGATEDPATGSAACALAAYLTLTEEGRGRDFEVTQGVEMGRRSVMSVETTTTGSIEGGDLALKDIWLGGTAVVVMRGSLRVEA
ncbi:Diaminopimelate epimerase-like protein [Xylariaceae sp. FL0804]|nr:Diaminopimelate epimerase-like protein [Xylariaceae sp. FL0804]